MIMTRPRTWLSLATVVPFDFLVAIAEHLIRVPRPQFEKGRTEPYSSAAELGQLLERYKGVKGVAIARRALRLARMGADSVQETRARAAFAASRLPAPELNLPVVLPGVGYVSTPDFWWPQLKVAAEYDGSHHRMLKTFTADRDKDEAYRSHGVSTVRLYATDLPAPRRGDSESVVMERLAGSRAVQLVAQLLRARGA